MTDHSEDTDKKIASIIRKELKSENYDDSCWLKAFSKADGDEQKAKVLYIDLRTNDLKKQKKKEKIKEDSKTHSYMRCGRSFCVSTYKILSVPKILIGVQKCQACGNILDYKVNENDAIDAIENPRSKPKTITKNTSDKVHQNLIEKIWWGNDSMSSIFWIYCIIGAFLFGILCGYLSVFAGPIILVILIIYIIWSNTGLWRSSEKYKKIKLKNNQSYGWATAAKIFVVLSYVVTLSQLGSTWSSLGTI